MTKIINLFGGPGSGKSSTAAGLFFLMKMDKYKVELVTEYAKELVYENKLSSAQSIDILYEQNQRLERLINKVDFVISDAPLLNTILYSNKPEDHSIAKKLFHGYNNINVLVERKKEFAQYGRIHTETESTAIDKNIVGLFSEEMHFQVLGNRQGPAELLNDLIREGIL